MSAWQWFAPAPPEPLRWVVLDTEASGLDPRRDSLLSIGAVGLRIDWAARQAALRPGDSFERLVLQHAPSMRANILVHGIGALQQTQGAPRQEVLAEFHAFAGAAPRIGFHAAFDRELLRRAGGPAFAGQPAPWLDLADLCAVVAPAAKARALDEWLDHFAIPCGRRHDAAADAWATGELLLRVFPAVARQCRNWRDVARLAASRRWLPRH